MTGRQCSFRSSGSGHPWSVAIGRVKILRTPGDPAMTMTAEACLARIGRLPHAAVIDPAHARRWVSLTLATEPERIGWHIARAGGIGGSEAGTLLAWGFPGEGNHSRGSALRMARQKLLMLPPDRANDDMSRGAYLEDFIRQVYEDKLTRSGVAWRRRDDLKAAIEAGPHPAYPWLRASLDAVYEIGGAVRIVDFKAPSTDMLQEYVTHRNFHDYRAQLNHYDLVASGHGVTVDGLELAMFDYRRVASNGCEVFPVERDAGMQQKLIAASGEFWHRHVGIGLLPERDEEPVLSANAGIPPEIEARALAAVVRKAALDRLKKDYEADQQAIVAWVGETGTLGEGVLPLGKVFPGDDAAGFLQVRAKLVLDSERAEQRLRDLGMPDAAIEEMRGPPAYDPQKLRMAYRKLCSLVALMSGEGADVRALAGLAAQAIATAPPKEKGRFDDEAVAQALESFGEVPYTFFTEAISSGLPRANSPDKEELLARVGGRVDDFVEFLVACMQGDKELPMGAAPVR